MKDAPRRLRPRLLGSDAHPIDAHQVPKYVTVSKQSAERRSPDASPAYRTHLIHGQQWRDLARASERPAPPAVDPGVVRTRDAHPGRITRGNTSLIERPRA